MISEGKNISDIQKVIPENAKAPKFEATMLFEKTGPKPAKDEEKPESDVEDSGEEVEVRSFLSKIKIFKNFIKEVMNIVN